MPRAQTKKRELGVLEEEIQRDAKELIQEITPWVQKKFFVTDEDIKEAALLFIRRLSPRPKEK